MPAILGDTPMDPILQTALAERDTLKKQREAIDERLKELEGFLSVYGRLKTKAQGQPAAARSGTRMRKASTQEIVDEVATILETGNKQTRGLLEELHVRGLGVTGKDDSAKVVTLSQILGRERARSGRFVNDRATGWALAKAPKAKAPADVDASAGAELRGSSTFSAQT